MRSRSEPLLASEGLCGFCNFFFSSRSRHTRSLCDWSSDVCSSDLGGSLGRVSVHTRLVTSDKSIVLRGHAVVAHEAAGGDEIAARGGGGVYIAELLPEHPGEQDRKRVGEGKGVNLGSRRIL